MGLTNEQISNIVNDLLEMSYNDAVQRINNMQFSDVDKQILFQTYDQAFRTKFGINTSNPVTMESYDANGKKIKKSGSYIAAVILTILSTLSFVWSIRADHNYYLIASLILLWLGIVLSQVFSYREGTIFYAAGILIAVIIPPVISGIVSDLANGLGYSFFSFISLILLICAWYDQKHKI